jgi:hypothetical protein
VSDKPTNEQIDEFIEQVSKWISSKSIVTKKERDAIYLARAVLDGVGITSSTERYEAARVLRSLYKRTSETEAEADPKAGFLTVYEANILREVWECARRWEAEVRVLGNVRASDIRKVCESIISRAEQRSIVLAYPPATMDGETCYDRSVWIAAMRSVRKALVAAGFSVEGCE